MSISQRGSFRAKVEAEHRDGICEVCGVEMVMIPKDAPIVSETTDLIFPFLDANGENITMPIQLPQKRKASQVCPKCGGEKGNLISRSISIQAPQPPQCIKLKCVWRFFCQIIFCGLLSQYHYRRVTYAEKNRHKKIAMKYRTGDDSPKTVRGTIWGIIKLSVRR